MNCAVARENWSPYLDGEADPELLLRVGDHLSRCPECADWFARQRRLEGAMRDRLAAGELSPALWGRVLAGAGVAPRRRSRLRLLGIAGGLAAAAVLAALLFLLPSRRATASALTREAVELHRGWLSGQVRPDFASASDLDVDRYFKASAPFKVHCPPRSDVNFAVQGAGMRSLRERHLAGLIVGRVGDFPVSILVLDRRSLSAFPDEQARLAGGRHRCQEGGFSVVSAALADNLVLVVGSARPEMLEKLLDAYGSYH